LVAGQHWFAGILSYRSCSGRQISVSPSAVTRSICSLNRAGYYISFQCAQEMPMVLMLTAHPDHHADVLTEHRVTLSEGVQSRDYHDLFGNVCTRLVAPTGLLEIRNEFVIEDSGLPDLAAPGARQLEIHDLPDETSVYLMGSRYCDTERLSNLAWSLFGGLEGGYKRVQAICDYVHRHVEFGYQHARSDRTAFEGWTERRWEILGYRPIQLLWTLAHGLKPTLMVSGTLSTPAIITRALVVS
jgi:hypothetical protein